MIQSLLLVVCSVFTSLAFAASSYQVNIILFANPQARLDESSLDSNIPYISTDKNAIPLGVSSGKTSKAYQVMSPTLSGLKDQNYLLSRRSSYQVLAHFSWIQPAKNSSKIILPKIDNKGWQIEGSMKIIQSSYYSVNADLQCSPPSFPEKSFTVSQTARIKGGELYYLDHQQIGMLVKILPVS